MNLQLKQILLVGLGGFLGAAGRFRLGTWLLQQTADWRFPLGTFAVNTLGCLLIGFLSGLGGKYGILSAEVRLFLIPGLLGGFTTFSAFAHEGVSLMRRGETPVALGYAAASVLCGFMAVWLGLKLAGDGSAPS